METVSNCIYFKITSTQLRMELTTIANTLKKTTQLCITSLRKHYKTEIYMPTYLTVFKLQTEKMGLFRSF